MLLEPIKKEIYTMRKNKEEQKEGTLNKGDWKKIRESKNKNIIEIKEETQIGNVILEEGDKIEVLNEYVVMPITVAINNYLNDNKNQDWTSVAVSISRSVEDAVTKNPSFSKEAYSILTKIGQMLQ